MGKAKNAINIIVIIIFVLLIAVPLFLMNNEKEVKSELDNRMLAENPFAAAARGENFADSVEAYLKDRIGLRSELIQSYLVMNDELWHVLTHPIYMYGKDREIFATFDRFYFDDYEYLDRFSDFVIGMQNYCRDNGKQFVFQYEPDKSAIKQYLLPQGINYDSSWTDYLFENLADRQVNYVDNISMLTELDRSGEFVYNHKYDAGHFNDNAAFYSVDNVLRNLHETNPAVHVNTKSEFVFGTAVVEKLTQSDFVVNEEVPENSLVHPEYIIDETSQYLDKVYFKNPNDDNLECYRNTEREKENAPTVLVFGGSHIKYERKYFQNSFSKYIKVTNYGNVANYDYYIEKFDPDIVVFEICERTIGEESFPTYPEKIAELRQAIDLFEESLK